MPSSFSIVVFSTSGATAAVPKVTVISSLFSPSSPHLNVTVRVSSVRSITAFTTRSDFTSPYVLSHPLNVLTTPSSEEIAAWTLSSPGATAAAPVVTLWVSTSLPST